jgi:hypothetical protein
MFAGKRQQWAKPEALTNGGDGLADEISRAECLAHVRRAQKNERRRLLRGIDRLCSRELQGVEKGGDVTPGCVGCQLGANLGKRVFEGNSRIASLAFGKNDRNTWWSSRRKTA